MAILRPREPRTGHAAGIFADMSLDGPHIGTLVVIIDRAKNLPNRRAIGKQDPYCAMRLGKEAKKTLTDRRGGQTPKWDTELRFNVHDSPDYMKLKTSIFNDDKKTDLIGEAWVELDHVIKRGGGQADLWQQLTCKGKYAGELRVELTYYDSRERPTPAPVVTERRKVRETIQAFSGAEDMIGETLAAVPRHIGPREIRRRPLPTGPAPQQTSTPSVQSDHQRASSLRQLDNSRVQDDHIHAPVPLRPRASPEPEEFETHDTDYFEQAYDGDDLTYAGYHDPSMAGPRTVDANSAYRDQRSYSETTSSYNTHHFQPNHMHSDPSSPYNPSPMSIRPGPLTTNSDSRLQQLRPHPRSAAMPVQKQHMFRDSPLRHSASYQNTFYDGQTEQAPPPIPPKHRETAPRRSQTDLPPSAYTCTPPRVASDRSPLQSIEDTYLTHAERHIPYYSSDDNARLYERFRARMHDQRTAWQEREFVPMPEVQAYRTQARPYQRHDYAAVMVDEPQSIDPTYDSSCASDRFQPSVEDAPSSPAIQPAVQRKAVGDQPKKLSSLPFDPDSYGALNPCSPEALDTAVSSPEQTKEAQRMKEVEKLRDLGPIIGNDGRVIDPSDHLPSDTWAPEPERKNKQPEHVIHVRSRNGPTGARPNVVVRHNGSSNFASTSPASSPASGDRAYSRTTAVRQQGARPLPTQPYPSSLASTPVAATPAASTNANFPPVAARPSPAGRRVSWNDHDLIQEIPPLHARNEKRNSWVERPDRSEYQITPTTSYSPRPSSHERPVSTQAYNSYRERTNPMKMMSGYECSSSPTSSSRPQSRHRNDDTPSRQHSWDIPAQQADARHDQRHKQYDDPLAAELSTIDLGPSRHTNSRTSNVNQQQQQKQRIYGQGYCNDERGMSMPALNTSSNNNRSMVRIWR